MKILEGSVSIRGMYLIIKIWNEQTIRSNMVYHSMVGMTYSNLSQSFVAGEVCRMEEKL